MLMLTGWLVSLALVAGVFAVVVAWRLPRLWAVLNGVGAVLALTAALTSLIGPEVWQWQGGWRIGGELPRLRLDGVSGLFLALVAGVGGLGSLYALEYWSDRERPDSAGRGRAWWSILMLSMMGVLLCANGLHFLMIWEAFAVSAFFLITLDRRRPAVRAAGWLYLGASHAGTLVLFAFFAWLAARTGTWNLGPWRDRDDLAGLFWLALGGFGVKAGVFPLHLWLPNAHANAPSHVSAMMSGVAIKMGLYGIVRFSGWLPLPSGAGWVVLALGACGGLVGAAFALAQNDLKRVLAYCSVENVGVILVGIGAGMLGREAATADWGRLAMAGALLHIWNHGLFKALLFFGAGSVLHATGTREMSRLGGLWRGMPWTAGLFALGSVAITALPPLNGFVSEWLIYLGLFASAVAPGALAKPVLPVVIALGVTGALALAAFVKAGAVVFLGAPRSKPARQAHECGWWMRVPMLLAGSACLGLGLFPFLAWPFLARAAFDWNPMWSDGRMPGALLSLGWWQVSLAAVLGTAWLILARRIRRRGTRRALTWDCGFAAPTPRMQYTAGSFAGIAVGWMRRAMRTEVQWRRPRGYFPGPSSRLEKIPETVLERVVVPMAGVVLELAEWLRRRQHGRLPDYILYLVAGLAAIGALVLL